MSPEHGTRRMYREGHCRCDDCRAWNADSMRRYAARVKARDGLSLTQKYRPGKATWAERTCSSCTKVIYGATDSATCSECRSRAKRGIYIRAADRLAIYIRDDWTCGICSEVVDQTLSGHDQWGPTLDHITPRSRGGSDDPTNLRLAHRACNSRRGARVS